MDCHWISIGFFCPACKGELKVTQVYASADGEIRFAGNCPKCKKDGLTVTTTAQKMVHLAMCKDVEEYVKQYLRHPADKSVVLADKDWLHDLGINGGE